MVSCSRCDNDLISEDAVVCSKCQNSLHFECAGMRETNYRKMSTEHKQSWKCPACKVKFQPTVSAACSKRSQPATPTSVDDENQLELDLLVQKLSPDVKAIFMLISKKLDVVIDSNRFVSEKYDEILDKMKENDQLVVSLRREMKLKDDRIDKLETEVHKLQQYSRVVNLEIRGVEKREGENVYEIVKNIAALKGVKLQDNDISIAHRVPNKRSKTEAIVVQFQNRRARENILTVCRSSKKDILLKDLLPNVKNTDSKVFVSEHLSTFYKELLWYTKEKAKDKDYKYVWFKNGKLLVKKGDGVNEKQVMLIESKADVDMKMK